MQYKTLEESQIQSFLSEKQSSITSDKVLNAIKFLSGYSYQIESMIDCGAFGVVMKGRDEENKRDVAVKLMIAQDYQGLQQSLLEFQKTNIFKHANIIECYRSLYDDQNESFYIISEYCSLGNLSDYSKKYKLKEGEIVDIMISVISAVMEIHSKKIIHGNLKPKNILLTADKIIKVGYLGLAKSQNGQASCTNENGGTISYMSSEQCQGKIIFESDTYSLGCILCFLCGMKIEEDILLMANLKNGVFPAVQGNEFQDLLNIAKQMVCVQPENRLSLSETSTKLQKLKQQIGTINDLPQSSSIKQNEEDQQIKEDSNNDKTFKLTKKLGSGAFTEVFEAIWMKNNAKYAVKLESVNRKNPQLFYEVQLNQQLQKGENPPVDGIPQIYYATTQNQYNICVMDLLGPSLEDLFNFCGRKFSLKTVLQIAEQMLQRIEFLHSRQFIHRDINPDNFLIGSGKNQNKIFMIDFGDAKCYLLKDGTHNPYKLDIIDQLNSSYCSINASLGIDTTRRDDLDSLSQVLLYFLKGSLPWQNIKAKNDNEKNELILMAKLKNPIEQMWKGLPDQFAKYMTYCRFLRYNEKPDYKYCLSLFQELFQKEGYQNDSIFDWDLIAKERQNKQDIIGNNSQIPDNQKKVLQFFNLLN